MARLVPVFYRNMKRKRSVSASRPDIRCGLCLIKGTNYPGERTFEYSDNSTAPLLPLLDPDYNPVATHRAHCCAGGNKYITFAGLVTDHKAIPVSVCLKVSGNQVHVPGRAIHALPVEDDLPLVQHIPENSFEPAGFRTA